MIVTRKEAKQARYVAKANGKAEYIGNGNTKHRVFYATGVEYDETPVDKDRVEISNIVKRDVPFDGTLDEFWDWAGNMVTVDDNTVTPDKITTEHEDIVDAVKMAVEHQTNVTEPGKVTILVPNEPHPVEVDPVPVDDDPLDNLAETSVDDILASMNPREESPEEPAAVSSGDAEGQPFSAEVVEPVPEPEVVPPQVATSEPATDMSVEAEFVGTPKNFIPKDATLQDAEVVGEPTRRELSQPELHALRTELAVRKLARSYGEQDGTTLQDIVLKHPDAMDRLNGIFSNDGITPYTMTEDSIRKSYEE